MYDKSVQNQPITSEQWAKSRHFFSSNFAEIVSESKQQFVVQEFVVNEDFRKNNFFEKLIELIRQWQQCTHSLTQDLKAKLTDLPLTLSLTLSA